MIIGTETYNWKAQINARIRELTHEDLYELINELDDDAEEATVMLLKNTIRIEGLNNRINALVRELQDHDPNWKPWW